MLEPLRHRLVSLFQPHGETAYSVLDIGCGQADLLHALSQRMNPASRLVGIDVKAPLLDQARADNPSIEYLHQRVQAKLPFNDETFDVVISVNMLECVADPTALIDDIARVLKPHGRVLCCHWDWDTQVYASEQRDRIRRLVQAYSDWQQGWMDYSDGMMGRKLWGLFQSTGHFAGIVDVFTLVETSYTPGDCGYDRLNDLAALVKNGEIGADDYEAVRQEMETRAQQDCYFYSLNAYTYIGQKRISGTN